MPATLDIRLEPSTSKEPRHASRGGIAYDDALAASKKPAELEAKLKAKHPNAALDIIVKMGVEAAFKKPEPASKKQSAPLAKAKAPTTVAVPAKK
jgi:hypothetical protein